MKLGQQQREMKRDKVVRITIENVDAPNLKVSSLKDVKDAPVQHKQVLLLKAKDHDGTVPKEIEKSKVREEKKKHIEKNIINRLSELLKRVKDIKQKHFHDRLYSSKKTLNIHIFQCTQDLFRINYYTNSFFRRCSIDKTQ